MKIPKKKRGRPRLSLEEKARRKAERDAAKAAAKKAGVKKTIVGKINNKNNTMEIRNTTSYLLTPSGKCPVDLFGSDIEAIRIWVSHAKNTGKSKEQHTLQSLSYWIRQYYPIGTKDYNESIKNLKQASAEFSIMDYSPILAKQYARCLQDTKTENIGR